MAPRSKTPVVPEEIDTNGEATLTEDTTEDQDTEDTTEDQDTEDQDTEDQDTEDTNTDPDDFSMLGAVAAAPATARGATIPPGLIALIRKSFTLYQVSDKDGWFNLPWAKIGKTPIVAEMMLRNTANDLGIGIAAPKTKDGAFASDLGPNYIKFQARAMKRKGVRA